MKAENAAAVARMQAAGAQRVYPLGSVPTDPTLPYAVISTGAGTPGNYRMTAEHGTQLVRVNVQCFGSTYDEAARTAERADDAFLDKALTELDPDATRCVRDVATVPERDPDAGGVLYALMSYTFTI